MSNLRATSPTPRALVWSLRCTAAIATCTLTTSAQSAPAPNVAAAPLPANRRPAATRTVARVDPVPAAQVESPEADRPARPQRPKKPRWDEHHGLFGPIRMGPVFGTGIPNIESFGFTSKLWGLFGFGFNIGRIPDMQLSFYGKALVRYRQWDLYTRLYPFRGGFYLGMGVGRHSVHGTIDNSIIVANKPYTTNSVGSVDSLIITPQVGYFRNFPFGLALGFGIGAQVPVAPSDVVFQSTASASVPREVVQTADQQIVDTLRTIGRTPLPQLELRVGWLF